MSTITLPNTLKKSRLELPGLIDLWHGKVRDIYHLKDGRFILVSSDRISAYDVVLPRQIPFKGQILNDLSNRMLQATAHTVPNWAIASPDPNVIIGRYCEPVMVEMVIRDRLTGSWWKKYHEEGQRVIAGYKLRDGMQEFDRFDDSGPIITPSTKAEEGDHDEDISEAEILKRKLCTEEQWETLCRYTLDLFREGTRLALQRGLILVDTKYEFGLDLDRKVTLIDEVNTPDSSRYFYSEGFDELVARRERPRQLSKEFVREWLKERGFTGKKGQQVPFMDDTFIRSVSDRYTELYECVTGEAFVPADVTDINARIQASLDRYL